MLVAALGVTLVGFVLLVIALITSSVGFAWACVVVCLIGFGLLLADVLGLRKGSEKTVELPAEPEAAQSTETAEDYPPLVDGEPADVTAGREETAQEQQ